MDSHQIMTIRLSVQQFVKVINNKSKPVDHKISLTKCEYYGKRLYTLRRQHDCADVIPTNHKSWPNRQQYVGMWQNSDFVAVYSSRCFSRIGLYHLLFFTIFQDEQRNLQMQFLLFNAEWRL